MHRRKLMPDEKRAYLFPYDSWANRVAVSAFVMAGHRTDQVGAQVREEIMQIIRRELDTGIPKNKIGGCEFFKPKAGFPAGIAEAIARRQHHQYLGRTCSHVSLLARRSRHGRSAS